MHIKPNRKLMLAAAAVVLLNFTSCKKYEDGPAFSLRSKTNRLLGEWEVVEIDNQDPSDDGRFIIEFERDGDIEFTYDYGSYSYGSQAEWEWEKGKEEIEIEFDNFREDWEITRLTNSELWFETDDKEEWRCEKL